MAPYVCQEILGQRISKPLGESGADDIDCVSDTGCFFRFHTVASNWRMKGTVARHVAKRQRGRILTVLAQFVSLTPNSIKYIVGFRQHQLRHRSGWAVSDAGLIGCGEIRLFY